MTLFPSLTGIVVHVSPYVPEPDPNAEPPRSGMYWLNDQELIAHPKAIAALCDRIERLTPEERIQASSIRGLVL